MNCPICSGSTCDIFPEWDNEEKMDFFFSFPKINEEICNEEMYAFWARAVIHYCDFTHRFLVTPEEIQKHFLRKGFVAQCLPQTFERMRQSGSLQFLEWDDDNEGTSLTRRVAGLAIAPVNYALSWVNPWAWQNEDKDGLENSEMKQEHVLQRAVAEISDVFAEHFKNVPKQEKVIWIQQDQVEATGSLGLCAVPKNLEKYSATEITRPSSLQELSQYLADNSTVPRLKGFLEKFGSKECEAVANYLVAQKKATKVNNMLRVDESGDLPTEFDSSVLQLQTLVRYLHRNVQNIQEQASSCRNQVIRAKKGGQTKVALQFLKRYKVLSGVAEQRLGALQTVERAYHQLQSTVLNHVLLETQTLAAQALAEARAGLDLEKVEDAMNTLQEEMQEHQDIDAALHEDVLSLPEEEELVLNAELAKLAEEDEICNSQPEHLEKNTKNSNAPENMPSEECNNILENTPTLSGQNSQEYNNKISSVSNDVGENKEPLAV